jgi:protein involved in polysaccharide export with SLBB domain
VKTLLLLPVLGCLLLSGCGGSNSSPSDNTHSGAPSDAIRIGDKITITLSGVPQDDAYLHEFQISEPGDLSVPNLARSFHAVGLRPGELANQITNAYKESKIYTNPNVSVIPEERYVSVGGDVRSPMRAIYTPDLTLLGAINSCGGFDEYADKHHVRIVRGTQVIKIDAAKVTNGSVADPMVYPGDQITVPRTIL